MKKPIKVVLLGIFSLFTLISLVAFCLYLPDIRKNNMLKHLPNISSREKYRMLFDIHQLVDEKLSVGMNKEDVRAILGEPMNIDREFIWMWMKVPADPTDYWPEMASEALSDGYSGFYLLFYEDKLVVDYLFKGVEGFALEEFRRGAGLSREEAKRILGIQ